MLYKKILLFSSRHSDSKMFLWWSWNLCDSGAVHGVTYRRRRFCLKRKNDWLSLPLNLVKKERIWDIQQPSRVHFRHPTLPQQWICRRPHLSHSSAAEMHLPSVYLPAQLLKLRWTRQELCPLIRCITWANPAPNLILHQVNQVQKSRANWPCSPSGPASPLECKSRGLQSFNLVICSH